MTQYFTMIAGPRAGRQNEGSVIYRCHVNCDDTGLPLLCNACDRTVLEDCYFCPRCLSRVCGVSVRPSTMIEGKGLFATRNFPKGSIVCHYGGEVIDEIEMENRYGWMYDDDDEPVVLTAPYAVGLDENDILDGARIRGAGCYVNSAHNLPNVKANCMLRGHYLRATRDIKRGDELFTHYGSEYWTTASDQWFTCDTSVQTSNLTIPWKRRRYQYPSRSTSVDKSTP